MTEESIYDSHAMRKFIRLSFSDEQTPDATTLLKFRYQLEENNLCEKLFEDLKERLESNGCVMRGGSIVDATIIKVVYGDAGYLGIEKREEIKHDANKSQIEYRINRRAGALRKDPKNLSNQFERQIESRKSSVRSKV